MQYDMALYKNTVLYDCIGGKSMIQYYDMILFSWYSTVQRYKLFFLTFLYLFLPTHTCAKLLMVV